MRHRIAAFSLIEVLVAFVIVSAVMVAVIPAYIQSSTALARRTQSAYAADYARSRLAQYGTLVPIVTGVTQGSEFDWTWGDDITRFRPPGSDDSVYRIEIKIFDRTGRSQLASVTGYKS